MSKVIHFSILGQTLCGAGDEPIDESRADTAEFCDDCVQAMWKEQYRRSVLLKVDKTEKPKKKGPLADGPQHFKVGRFAQVPGAKVNHMDPYRLQTGKIAALVDFEPMFRDDVTLVEWPERLGIDIGKYPSYMYFSPTSASFCGRSA